MFTADGYETLIERTLTILPKPSHMNSILENDGSISHLVWFKGETETFSVESSMLMNLLV